jgi:nucleoside-diphosphate-sugar epimerase
VRESKKILVTGASGFVGSEVVRELESAGGYEIYGLIGKGNAKMTAGVGEAARFFRCDIADYEGLRETVVLKGTEVLVHTAGLAHQFGKVKREDFWRVNAQGTENICRMAVDAGVRHLILISSVAVYGDHGNSEIDETFVCKPSGVYAESKFESENRAIEICGRRRSCGFRRSSAKATAAIRRDSSKRSTAVGSYGSEAGAIKKV